jgi:hypothetical protein
MMKSLAAAGGVLVLVAAGATVALVGGSGTAAAAGTPSSAFALELRAAGNDVIARDMVASVESTDGALVTSEAGAVPDNPLGLGLGVFQVEAENGRASASVAELRLDLVGALIENDPTGLGAEGFAALGDACDDVAAAVAPLDDALAQVTGPAGTTLQELFGQLGAGTADTPLTLDLLEGLQLPQNLEDVNLQNIVGGLCDVLEGVGAIDLGAIQAECNGDSGTSTIAVAGLGQEFQTVVDNIANSALGIDDVAVITPNRQTANPDGTFTVDGLHVDLFDGQLELTVASATCGEVTADAPPPPKGPKEAPAPNPVPGDLPVTG